MQEKAVCSALVHASTGVPWGEMLPKDPQSPPGASALRTQPGSGSRSTLWDGWSSWAWMVARGSLVVLLCAAAPNTVWLLNRPVSPGSEGRNPGSPPQQGAHSRAD